MVYFFIPLIIIVAMFSWLSYQQYQTIERTNEHAIAVELSIKISNIINLLQKERGLSQGYITSGDAQQKKLVDVARNNTRLAIAELIAYSNRNVDLYGETADLEKKYIDIFEHYLQVLTSLESLKAERLLIDQGESQQSFSVYTQIIAKLTHFIEDLQYQFGLENMSKASIEFLILIELQELAGQERGLFNGVLAKPERYNVLDIVRVVNRGHKQNETLDNLYSIASNRCAKGVKASLSSKENIEIIKNREHLEHYIQSVEKTSHLLQVVDLADHIQGMEDRTGKDREALIAGFIEKVRSLNSTYYPVLYQDNSLSYEHLRAIEVIASYLNRLSANLESGQEISSTKSKDVAIALIELQPKPLTLSRARWWKITTSRIEALAERSTLLAIDMLTEAERLQRFAYIRLVLLIVLIFLPISASLYIAKLIRKRIVSSTDQLVNAMIEGREYQNFRLLKVTGNDEFAQMTKSYNHMVNTGQEYEASLNISAKVFNHASEAIIITNKENVIEMINPAFTKITGYSFDEVQGQNPSILSSGRHDDEFFDKMWQGIKTGSWQGEVWNRRKNGELYPQLVSISVIRDQNHQIVQHIALFSDISKNKQFEHDLWHKANFDELTGFANRKNFMANLSQDIERPSTKPNGIAVVIIDLDRFKFINDSLGYKSGDELIAKSGVRISQHLEKNDLIARLGGDEFVIKMSELSSSYSVERKIEAIRKSFELPIVLANGHETVISISIGVSFYGEDGKDAEVLFRNADTALYQSKANGRNRFHFFKQSMNELINSHMELEQQLRRAVIEQQFCLHFQPVFSLAENNIVGAEALIRWNHPEKGLVYPDTFIEMAEETLLIEEIGLWVINKAAEVAKQWHLQGHHLYVAVNASSKQTNLASAIANTLAKYELPAEYFKLELTESLLMENSSTAIAGLHAVRKLGVEVYLDALVPGIHR